MNKIVFILATFLYCVSVNAQTNKSTISIGLGGERLFYTNVGAPAIELGLNRALNNRFSINVNASASKGKETASAQSFSNGQIISSYELDEKETVLSADLSLLYSFTGNEKRINVKMGGGISYVHSFFNYPSGNITVEKGKVISGTRIDYNAGSPLLNIVAEGDIKINSRLILGLRAIFRTIGSTNYQHYLERTTSVKDVNGTGFGTGTRGSGIIFNGLGVVKIGYMF
jgi:hypothetical protein